MWDQVRMGWKAAYPALRVLESLHAWRELEVTGLVERSITDTPRVTQQLLDSVKMDIVAQLGQSDGTLLTWRSCTRQAGPSSPPSGLQGSSCDRDDPHATDQHSYDLGFVPDHALAVKLGVIPSKVLLRMMASIRHRSGHRLAVKSFESNDAPLIMVDSEKWKYLDSDGYAEARPDQAGWAQVFRPPRTDGPGNYGNHEQNGGRLFSVSKLIFEATLYPEAADDWAEQVQGSSAIATVLMQGPNKSGNCSSPLPFPSLVREAMQVGSLAQVYCRVAYGAQGSNMDCFGKTPCDFFADMTWGLRDGQLGPMLQLPKALLGLTVIADGSLRLYNETVHPDSCITAACRLQLTLPSMTASTWPAGVSRIELGGINVGTHRNVSVACTVTHSETHISLAYSVTTDSAVIV